MEQRRKSILWGGVLIVIGILALLNTLGRAWFSMERLWPLLLEVGGVAALISALTKKPRDTDGVWFGLTAMGCGAVFAYITLGAGQWNDMRWMWPVFPLIAGVAWLISWFLDLRQISNLVMAVLGGLAGVVGFFYTRGRLEPNTLNALASYWPAILIVIGIGLIAQFTLQRK